jgi:hypothetical protein
MSEMKRERATASSGSAIVKHLDSPHNNRRIHLASLSSSSPLARDLVRVLLSNFERVLISRLHAFSPTQEASPPPLLLLVGLLQREVLVHLPLDRTPLSPPQPLGHLDSLREERRTLPPHSAQGPPQCSERVLRRPHLGSRHSQPQALVLLPHPNASFLVRLNLSYSPYKTPLSVNSAWGGHCFSSIYTFPRERYGWSDDCHSALPNDKRNASLS